MEKENAKEMEDRVETLKELDIKSKKKDKVDLKKEKPGKKLSKKETLKLKAAKNSKKITEFFSTTSAEVRNVSCTPMEIDAEENVPDDEEMEVDILSWEIRDAIMRSREKAVRLRRARFQRSTLLTALAVTKETRVKMAKWLEELLLNLWWTEQMIKKEVTMIQGEDLTITAKWGINQDKMVLHERGEVSGRGKFLEWEVSLRVTSLQERAEMIRSKIVGEVSDLIINNAWVELKA